MFALLLAASAADPLLPHDKWTIDYGKNTCILSRSFGPSEQGRTLGIENWPLSDRLTFVLMQADGRDAPPNSPGTITIGTGQLRAEGFAESRRAANGMFVSKVDVASGDLGAFTDTMTIGVSVNGQKPTWLRPDKLISGMKALQACQADLLTQWQLDPTEPSRTKTPAIAIKPEDYITNDDYPAEAIRAGEQGTVHIVYSIELDGRVGECRAVVSSGVLQLDAAACKAIKRRGRFNVAIGTDGRPMVTHQIRKVIWSVGKPIVYR